MYPLWVGKRGCGYGLTSAGTTMSRLARDILARDILAVAKLARDVLAEKTEAAGLRRAGGLRL